MSDKAKDLEGHPAGPGAAGAAASSAGGAPVEVAPEPSSGELEIEVEGDGEGAGVGDVDPAATAQARIAELEAKQKDTHDRLLRALADNENFKRRVKKDVDDARTDASGKVLREMLPVVDNLERALAHAEKQGGGDAGGMVEGVRLVLRQFVQAFERVGVTAIDAKGKPFDPNLHEAVSQQESGDHPAGTVLEVLQTGYKIGERLLRPTLTVVSRAPSNPAPTPAEGGGPDAEA